MTIATMALAMTMVSCGSCKKVQGEVKGTESMEATKSEEAMDEETNSINGYNAEIMRVPIEMNFQFRYVLSNFNEAIVLIQEIIDKFIYQKFFTIIYLGQKIRCGIEFPTSAHPELNKIDMSSNKTKQKILQFDIKLTSNYPAINERTEVSNTNIINSSKLNVSLSDGDKPIDKEINTNG